MEQHGILIKTEDSYLLKDGDNLLGIDNKSLKERVNCEFLLCSDNCISIEKDYDLNELAEYALEKKQSKHKLISPSTFTDGFKKGGEFVEAWLNPKKFTTIQLLDAFKYGKANDWDAMEKLIDSVEKTEWPVTWNTGETDLKGCLILKRL